MVFAIANVLAPFGVAFGHGEMGHEVVGRGPVPVPLVPGRVDDVTGADWGGRARRETGRALRLGSRTASDRSSACARRCVRPARSAGRNPYDGDLTDLVGELSMQSEDFRVRWAAHNVRFHRTGHKRLHHPIVGALDLDFEAMEFPAHPGLTLLAYTAAAGTPTADSLRMLASWAATAEQAGDLPAYA